MPTFVDADLLFPRLAGGRLLQVRAKSKLESLKTRLLDRYGPGTAVALHSESTLERAAASLSASGGDLSTLTHREKKAAIELCWGPRAGWKPDAAFVRRWLEWAEEGWTSRAAPTRIAISYVRNYDGEAEATKLVAAWLSPRLADIGGYFGELFRRYGLAGGRDAVAWIATSLADGSREFFARVDANPKTALVFRASGVVAAAVEAYGRRCERERPTDVPTISKALVTLAGGTALGGKAPQRARDAARVAFVVGMVEWAGRVGGEEAIEAAVAACLSVAGDPRHPSGQWRDLPAATVETVQYWLTARTIENMFRVIETLKTDSPAQVESRLAFWRGYLPSIRKAYLLCANKAKPIAEALGESYGSLEGGESVHCGLLMEILGPQGDRLVVLETNKNASALFWHPKSKLAPPPFYDVRPYYRPTLLHACDSKLPHTGYWQATLGNYIEGATGVRGGA